MRSVTKYYALVAAVLVFCITTPGQNAPVRNENDDPVAKGAFMSAINAYIAKRRDIEARVPSLSTEATPEQLAAHKATLLTNIRALRKGAKRGDIFTPVATAMVLRIVKENYTAPEVADLKAENTEADTKGVELKVNAVYPEGREKIEMPPRLLLALPQLPDEVNFHFVDKDLLIIDKESGLILDFMRNALP